MSYVRPIVLRTAYIQGITVINVQMFRSIVGPICASHAHTYQSLGAWLLRYMCSMADEKERGYQSIPSQLA